MIEKYANSNEAIEKEIYATFNKFNLQNVKVAERYDSLTIEYKKYLNSVFMKIFERSTSDSKMDYSGDLGNPSIINELFYENKAINSFGNEYLRKQEEYRIEVTKLIKNRYLFQRVNESLRTDSPRDRYGNEIKYLDYFFKDMPPIAVMLHIQYTQNIIIQFENDYFKNLVIEK
ncbi:hypothetical protein [Flagellimonas alvinocaridis]|nr:hypothetical protein [Allomuricauda alvinocaridis]